MSTVVEAGRIGFFRRLQFHRAVSKTLIEMKEEGFAPATAEEAAEECCKRLAEPKSPDTAALIAASVGFDPADAKVRGPFLDALLQFFMDALKSSMLMTWIKIIFGL